MSNATTPRLRRFRLKIPDLVDRPAIGAGCCAYPAFNAIADSVLWLEGVTAVLPSDRDDEVLVELDATTPKTDEAKLKEISEAIAGLDFQIAEIVEEEASQIRRLEGMERADG